MTRPRIVILANNIDEVGGAQRVVHVVAQHLGLRGYPVDLVGIAPFEPRHEYVAEPSFRRLSLMSEPWPAPPRTARPDLLMSRRHRAVLRRREQLRDEAETALARLLAEGEPGVVVTAQLWAMEFLARVPHDGWAVIGQYHSSFEAAAAGRDLRRAIDLYADIDLVTLLTPEDAADFRRAGLNATAWLPNPLAFWPHDPVDPVDPVEAHGGGTITYLGRFSTEKGVAFLLDAWGRVADAHPGWRLRLVGSGPEEKTLRAQAGSLGAGVDRIEFAEPVQDSEAELRRADILVLPSLTEGLPLVLAEAMAVGLPCVATDCSAGVRLLARDGAAARLVARGDAGALAGALSALMDDREERLELGALAREAVRPYRADEVIDAWERMIAEVLR